MTEFLPNAFIRSRLYYAQARCGVHPLNRDFAALASEYS